MHVILSFRNEKNMLYGKRTKDLSKYKDKKKILSSYNESDKIDTISNESINACLVCLSSRSHPQWIISDFYYD